MRIFRIGEVDHPEIAGAKVIAEREVLPGSEQLQEWPSLLRALQLAKEKQQGAETPDLPPEQVSDEANSELIIDD
jgi:hypothetical protein